MTESDVNNLITIMACHDHAHFFHTPLSFMLQLAAAAPGLFMPLFMLLLKMILLKILVIIVRIIVNVVT